MKFGKLACLTAMVCVFYGPLAWSQGKSFKDDMAERTRACTACHGIKLTGVQDHVPGLLGLPLDYLNAQLGARQGR